MATLLQIARDPTHPRYLPALKQLALYNLPPVRSYITRGTGSKPAAEVLLRATLLAMRSAFHDAVGSTPLTPSSFLGVMLAFARRTLGLYGYLPYVIHELPDEDSSEDDALWELLNWMSTQDPATHEVMGLWAAGLPVPRIAGLLHSDEHKVDLQLAVIKESIGALAHAEAEGQGI